MMTQGGQVMRKEDLKNWTREQMKSEILRLYRKLELFGIKFEENPNNFSFSHSLFSHLKFNILCMILLYGKQK